MGTDCMVTLLLSFAILLMQRTLGAGAVRRGNAAGRLPCIHIYTLPHALLIWLAIFQSQRTLGAGAVRCGNAARRLPALTYTYRHSPTLL